MQRKVKFPFNFKMLLCVVANGTPFIMEVVEIDLEEVKQNHITEISLDFFFMSIRFFTLPHPPPPPLTYLPPLMS